MELMPDALSTDRHSTSSSTGIWPYLLFEAVVLAAYIIVSQQSYCYLINGCLQNFDGLLNSGVVL